MKKLLTIIFTLCSVACFAQYSSTPTWTMQSYLDNGILKFRQVRSDNYGHYPFILNPLDQGAKGDSVTNNTTIFNNLLSKRKSSIFGLPEGKYVVDNSYANSFGSTFIGPGKIVKNITGGQQLINTGNRQNEIVSGREFMVPFWNTMLARGNNYSTPLSIAFEGDSRIAGDAITLSTFKVPDLFKFTSNMKGIANINAINNGHSGIDLEHWRTNYLPADIAANPDIFVIMLGINDPFYLKNGTLATDGAGQGLANRRDIASAQQSLDLALQSIRQTYPNKPIVLISPFPAGDTPNGRDEMWCEQLRKVYIAEADKRNCAFIDGYNLILNMRQAVTFGYGDNPYSDGRSIHLLNAANSIIVNELVNLFFPDPILEYNKTNHLINQSFVDRSPAKSELPYSYFQGLTMNRATLANGWTNDGSSLTFMNADLNSAQFNYNYYGTPEITFRTGGSNVWSNEVRIFHSGNLRFDTIPVPTYLVQRDFSGNTFQTGIYTQTLQEVNPVINGFFVSTTTDAGLNVKVRKVSIADAKTALGITAAQIQSDWNQTNTSALDYIKNKPAPITGRQYPVLTEGGDPVLTYNDYYLVYPEGSGTVTLPVARPGQTFVIKNKSGNAITVIVSGGGTLDNNTSLTIASGSAYTLFGSDLGNDYNVKY